MITLALNLVAIAVIAVFAWVALLVGITIIGAILNH